MRLLVFEPFHGAAGDMIIGSLLGCGADKEMVRRAMGAVVANPTISEVTRAGIQAIKIDTHATPVHRSLSDVLQRIDEAAAFVPAPALEQARRVFKRINDAEESVHGDHVHFHEVGADDAIADVIGACTALFSLHIDGVVVLPVAVGSGTGSGSHGSFPIPAPATAAILRSSGLVTRSVPWTGELLTPTGAALLAEFSTHNSISETKILAIGYGAGTRDPKDAPNVLRAMLVETTEHAATSENLSGDEVDILETNIDDVTGEVIGNALTRFMDEGARDASALPIIMKKGRPGFLVRVICSGNCSAKMAELMARELGTLGIRCIPAVHRFIAERTVESVEVIIGNHTRTVPVKCGWIDGKIYSVKAEFDPARDLAHEMRLPVKDVLHLIERAARKKLREKLVHSATIQEFQ